jgi:hypothetical protein
MHYRPIGNPRFRPGSVPAWYPRPPESLRQPLAAKKDQPYAYAMHVTSALPTQTVAAGPHGRRYYDRASTAGALIAVRYTGTGYADR